MSRSSRKRWTFGGLVVGICAMVALAVSLGAGTAAVVVAPVNTSLPTITGTPQVGQSLTAAEGTWSNSPTSFAYEWLRCNGGGNACASVANGTQKTYTPVANDAGRTIRVRVTATNADGSASAQSDYTGVVAAAVSSAAPKNTSVPTIAGIAKVGQQLTASEGRGRVTRPATPTPGSDVTPTSRRARTSPGLPGRPTSSCRRLLAIACVSG